MRVNSHERPLKAARPIVADVPECRLLTADLASIPLWIPARLVIHRLVVVGAERHRFWLYGLGHVLKGDACESTEDWCGRASAKGLRGYCCEQVRWRGSRHLHGAAVTAAPELGRPSLVPSSDDDQSSICSRERRDANTAVPRPLPQAGSRSQLEAGELFSVHMGRTILSSPAASMERTPTTIHIARRHMRCWPG
jgi:hypothetical protein